MQHVDALVRLAFLLALLTTELDAPGHKEWAPGRRIAHLYEARVKVDFGREGGDCDEGRGADAEDGRDGLVEEALVTVGGFFQNKDVAAGALGGTDLRRQEQR